MAKKISSHEPFTIANATAATVAVIYVVCAAGIALFPVTAMTIARSWFHGVRLEAISGWNLAPGSLVFGFITAVIAGWLVGLVFAKFQNFFER